MGDDFYDIRDNNEKKGERRREESSFLDFWTFITEMQMGEIKFRGEPFTWANNREVEGFIQERLDRFFGSSDWMIEKDTAEVRHFLKQASDHSLLISDTMPTRRKTKGRFIFASNWFQEPASEQLVKEAWTTQYQGPRMFQVKQKLKCCKVNFLRWRKGQTANARKEIELIQKEMEGMQKLEGSRDWDSWRHLKSILDEAYKAEELFWQQKSRV